MNRKTLANAVAAMKAEWDIGPESKAAWKEFVTALQEGRVILIGTSEVVVDSGEEDLEL
jgi:hypothetical protein